MTDDRPDPLDLLSDLRPTAATLADEWPLDDRDDLRDDITAERRGSRAPRFVARSRSPLRRVAVPAAAAAVAVLMAGTVLAVVRGGNDAGNGDGLPPAGDPFTATSVVATPEVGARQYAFRETTAYTVRDGRLAATGVTQDWMAPGGYTWSYRTERGSKAVDCFRFPHSGEPDFQNATKAWLDGLPTGTGALRDYMRGHVSGSTSREEAVFVAVGDTLRSADLLASSALRAAFVAVLSRTDGVAVHRDVRDSRDRLAVRADFVDPRNRPGELSSLYFDPRTFQLVEESSRSTAPTPYESQSYSVAPPSATTPDTLPSPTATAVVTSERVVDTLPAKVRSCPVQD